jgi:hypothetical protein
MCARTVRVVFSAQLIKQLVLYLLTLLSVPSPNAFAGTRDRRVPCTDLQDFKALTRALPECAGRSRSVDPTGGSSCQCCRTPEAVRRPKRPRIRQQSCRIKNLVIALLAFLVHKTLCQYQ